MNRSSAISQDLGRLPKSYKPSQNDVIIGTGRDAQNHIGNKNLLNIVQRYKTVYSKASKAGKSNIISQIIRDATIQSPLRTPFVKSQNGHWYIVEDEFAREKVSQTMRNLLHNKYKSSTVAKRERRVQNYQHFDAMVYSLMKKNGSFIAARMRPLFEQIERNKQKSDEQVCEIFTQANADILEALKSLSLQSEKSNQPNK